MPPVVVLFGPTAVGKTQIIEKCFPAGFEVIAADSVQVYRGFDIGSAKPGKQVRQKVPHHLIDVTDGHVQFTAGEFVRRAEELVRQIATRGHCAVVSGGTAYYLRSFLYGLPDTPAGDDQIRRALDAETQKRGLPAMYRELELVDREAAAAISPRDRYRILRALEIYRTSGKKRSEIRVPTQMRQDFRVLIVGLERERAELYRRIDERVEQMFAAGLVEEVKGLLRAGYTAGDPAMRAIGYREFHEVRRGCLSLSGAKELIKRNSRRYAKRQWTFFRKFPRVVWLAPDRYESLKGLVTEFLADSPEAHVPSATGA